MDAISDRTNDFGRGADRLTDRVAVIVGASSGIGAETARELALRGANVVVAARRREALEQVAKSAKGLGRLGTAGEVAAVGAFLARPEAFWVNRHLITVNGGASI